MPLIAAFSGKHFDPMPLDPARKDYLKLMEGRKKPAMRFSGAL
jgi:hypothetical protein